MSAPLHVVILSARRGWHTEELCRALGARGHSSEVLPYEGLVARLEPPFSVVPPGGTPAPGGTLTSDGHAVMGADAVLARIIPAGSLEQIIFRVDALHWIEEQGIPVMNPPRAIERCVDKFYTDVRLRQAGLPTPETIVCESSADVLRAIREMGDVIVKPIFGSMGHGLVRVSDPELAVRIVRPLEQMRTVFYVQRALAHDGRDVRVFVAGGQVLGAIEREAPDGDWRSNVARGGRAHAIDLPAAWADLAVRAAAAVGADYAGVDLLPARDGTTYVLEVNGIPGWQGLQRATGVDVASALVAHLEARCAARKALAAPEVCP
jgi:RimK family alpha-L-glutamate ligase